MFDLPPATRRAGERAAVDDLGTPVVVVDDRQRVVDLNDAATDLFGVAERAVLARPLEDLLGTGVDLAAESPTLSLRPGGNRREFKVVASPFDAGGDDHTGHTIVLQDVTAENQRKQRLDVLNRILRHNLRNDLGLVAAYGDELARTADDDDRRRKAETVVETAQDLVELGEKARRATEALSTPDRDRPFPAAEAIDAVADELAEEFPGGAVEVAVPDELHLRSDERLFRLVVREAIENGLEHHDGESPGVEVSSAPANAENSVRFLVVDDGPGLPDYERRVVEGGEESDLEHGSGVGLWLIRWAATALGGDVTFEADDDGTTVELRIPGVVSETRE